MKKPVLLLLIALSLFLVGCPDPPEPKTEQNPLVVYARWELGAVGTCYPPHRPRYEQPEQAL